VRRRRWLRAECRPWVRQRNRLSGKDGAFDRLGRGEVELWRAGAHDHADIACRKLGAASGSDPAGLFNIGMIAAIPTATSAVSP